ncbi:hypothetical protein NE256_06185 [Enterococcus faecium]|uniref:hypothetical protein n=1 Tax=Enterococcus faecium TaxID=1352 RepID=UPI002073BF30|nr:hypothetical protein [Enterococcus faecium]MCM6870394.1 hypothetical protein [Enterococcus faecium]MCM6875993.1 hypothetical protein [Enterococcus faecium]MCM6888721.1 hypothetical protein [Enterococcus faecium]MCM6891669.1 hypothetical protein [Enterococcus faecium]MCM6909216.1 hypothetical protein [Enterococcus faecium]
MFKIAFYLFDYKDGSFKKVYFHHWNDSKPVFTKNKKRAKKYFDERSANKDIVQLKKVESPSAKTLSIKLEDTE